MNPFSRKVLTKLKELEIIYMYKGYKKKEININKIKAIKVDNFFKAVQVRLVHFKLSKQS